MGNLYTNVLSLIINTTGIAQLSQINFAYHFNLVRDAPIKTENVFLKSNGNQQGSVKILDQDISEQLQLHLDINKTHLYALFHAK